LSLAEKIIEALNKGMITIYEREKEEHPKIIGKYHPSSIGECIKKQYYDFYLARMPTTEKLAIFATGRGIHEIIAEILENSNVVKVEAKELETKLDFGEAMLSGRVDVIVADVEGEKIIIEVKSTSQSIKEPYKRHILQIQSYLHALNVQKGIILYWDKRRGVRTTFEVEKNDELLSILKERTLSLHNYIKNKIEPPREAVIEKDFLQCINCEYLQECRPLKLDVEDESELAIFELDNIIFNTNKRMEMTLKELNLDPNVNFKQLDKDLKEKIFNVYYSDKYINFDEPIHENINKALELYMQNKRIVIITNRPPHMEKCTSEQLMEIGLPYEAIFFRNSHFKGINFKSLIVNLLISSGYKIFEIFDEYSVTEKIKKRIRNDIKK